MATTEKELERIRREGLQALKEKLGIEVMIKFIQMYSEGKEDYTKERRETLEGWTEKEKEDLKKYLREELEEK